MSMAELQYAMHMRDVIDRMVREALNKERPRYRYATVSSIDRAAFKATVIYVGETNPVQVNMGGLQPMSVGQTVRVAGIGTDKFIDDVMGEPWGGNVFHVAANEAEQFDLVDEFKPTQARPLFVARTDAPGAVDIRGTLDGKLWFDVAHTRRAVPFIAPALQNGWVPYGSGFRDPGYFKTSANIVSLTGLIRSGTATANTVLFNLPEGYRPDAKIMFAVASSGGGVDGIGSVQILPNGDVQVHLVPGNGWISLAGISFPAADPARVWTPVSLDNSFIDYATVDTAWPAASYWQDSLGRVWFRGLLRRASAPAADTAMFTLPVGLRPELQIHTVSRGNSGFQSLDIRPDGGVYWKINSSNSVDWISLQNLMFVPASVAPNSKYVQFAYLNSWTTYSSQYPPQMALLMADGMVLLSGLIKSGTAGATGILPADYREGPGITIFTANANSSWARTDLRDQGHIATTGSNVWRSLDGIHFIAGA